MNMGMLNNGRKTKRAEYAEQILARLKKIDTFSEDEKAELEQEIRKKGEILQKHIDKTLMKPLVRKWIYMDTFDEQKSMVLEHLFGDSWANAMQAALPDSFDEKAPLTETRYECAKLFHESCTTYGFSFEDNESGQLLENYLVRYLANKVWKEEKADFDFVGKPCYWKNQYLCKVYKQNGRGCRFDFNRAIALNVNLFEDEVVWLSDEEGLVRIPLNKIVAMEFDQRGHSDYFRQYNLLHLYLENAAGIYLEGSRWALVELKEAITHFKTRGARPAVSSERAADPQQSVSEPQPQPQMPPQPIAVELQPTAVELRPAPTKDDASAVRSAETFEPDLRAALYPLYERLQQIDAEQAYSTFCMQWGRHYRKGGVLFVGRAVNGWITDDRDTATLFKPGDKSQIFARDDQMCWVERENICARSAFWRVVRGLSRQLTGNSADWYERIAYSNLYKLAPASGGNPSNTLCSRQYDLCAEILRREIEVLAPSAVLLLCGVGWYYDFLCSLNDDTDPECIDRRTWSEGAIDVYRIGKTVYIGGDHPQGKDEGAYVAVLAAILHK